MTPPLLYERHEPRYLPPRARMHCPQCETRCLMVVVAWPEPATAIRPRCSWEWRV
jgi:hypothetical protein